MKKPTRPRKRQLALFVEKEASHRPSEDVREELVRALADLLLEALGDRATTRAAQDGGRDESENHE